MAIRGFEISERIERPVETVWNLMSDLENAPEWMAEVERIETESSTRLGQGARLRTYVKRSKAPLVTEIVAWSPPLAMALRSRQGGITAVYTYRCTPAGDGTKVTLRASCTAEGLLWQLLHPLIAMMMRRADGGQLAALKAVAER